MEFKALKGRRVLLEKPMRPASPIELSPEVQANLDQEFMRQWVKLKVFAIGDDVTEVSVGDEVYVGQSLQHAEVLDIDGAHFLMVAEHEIAIVW